MSAANSLPQAINEGSLVVKVGAFAVRIQSEIPSVQQGIQLLYQDYPRLAADTFSDFFVRVFRPTDLRRYFGKQALFALDQHIPFKPLPLAQALPFFEWGLNWCMSNFAHENLVIHAAVVEKNGKALILPGMPGSGKSTLCAALINQDWRLLSDELTMVNCATGKLIPAPRPVSLKNQSITLIAERYPGNRFSPVVNDTLKGTVSLMQPPRGAVERAAETALPCLVVFPKFKARAPLQLTALTKGEAFMKLAELSFNYSVLGPEGFRVLADLVEQSAVYDFVYDGDFDRASNCFEELLDVHAH